MFGTFRSNTEVIIGYFEHSVAQRFIHIIESEARFAQCRAEIRRS